MGFQNQHQIKTPTFNALAGRGIHLTQVRTAQQCQCQWPWLLLLLAAVVCGRWAVGGSGGGGTGLNRLNGTTQRCSVPH